MVAMRLQPENGPGLGTTPKTARQPKSGGSPPKSAIQMEPFAMQHALPGDPGLLRFVGRMPDDMSPAALYGDPR